MAIRHDFVGRHQRKTQGTEQPSKQADWASILVLEVTVLAVVVPATAVALTWRVPVLQFAAAVILSSLPGFLYVRFVEFRGPSVWNEYVFNLHRLRVERDRDNLPLRLSDRRSADEVTCKERSDNIYTQKFDAHFGATNRERWEQGTQEADQQHTRRRPPIWQQLDLLMPILLSTLVITIGWVTIFAEPAFLAGFPNLSDELHEALRAGFLGSYVFVIQFLVRRYFQNDLKASAYYAVTERFILVPIIVAILTVALPMTAHATIAVAFVVGVFPVVGLRAINSVVARSLRGTIPSLHSTYPLSDLDGMTIWYETRLLEEGIEDLQSLITANVVDLMLNTRIPVGRIVDWLDQAYLYIHLAPLGAPSSRRRRRKTRQVAERAAEKALSEVDPGAQAGTPPHALHRVARRAAEEATREVPSDREVLRRHGIRCATDLEDAFAGYCQTDPPLACRVATEDRCAYYKGLKNLLNVEADSPSVTLTILNCLQRNPNLDFVRSWKTPDPSPGDTSADAA